MKAIPRAAAAAFVSIVASAAAGAHEGPLHVHSPGAPFGPGAFVLLAFALALGVLGARVLHRHIGWIPPRDRSSGAARARRG